MLQTVHMAPAEIYNMLKDALKTEETFLLYLLLNHLIGL